MKKTFVFPNQVSSNDSGYTCLIELINLSKTLFVDTLVLDFRNTDWFEANLLAILGAILNQTQENLNTIEIENLHPNLEKAFSKNHFLSNFGGVTIDDFYGTSIKYKRFKAGEEKLFKVYLDNELLIKKSFPKMSAILKKKVNESIFEIFNNAIIHGDTKYIFSCGQYYPRKSRLDFTLVDIGRTIKKNVNSFLNEELRGSKAIQWAVTEGNTTKRGDIPGGLGLSLIRNFLAVNGGKIQIVSSDGYWFQRGKKIQKSILNQPFEGTIVNLEFLVDDQNKYYLTEELKPEEIF